MCQHICFAIGFIIGISQIILFIIYTGYFKNGCNFVNGRECNNRGICLESGRCKCEPQFSGDSCQYTKCPGYNPLSGVECSGNGICSPLMTYSTIPKTCQETIYPDFSLSGGWNDPLCGVFEADMKYMPQCFCYPPFSGPSCELNMCPVSSDFKICSDNGNKSVGLTKNDTGDGCQCVHFISLTYAANTFKPELLDMINKKYLLEFKKGFCGTPVYDGNLTFQITQDLNSDYQCFCDEQHYGIACEFGVCPTSSDGKVCSGHGFKEAGFNKNTTCEILCIDNSTTSCLDIKYCTLESPYRCPSGKCVSLSHQDCTREFTPGVWDVLYSLPYVFLEVRDRYVFSKRIYSVQISSIGYGEITVLYGDNLRVITSPSFESYETFEYTYYPYISTGFMVNIEKISPGFLSLFPLMTLESSIRVFGDNQYMVIDVVAQLAYLDNFGIFVMYETNPGYVYSSTGTSITVDTCLNRVYNCVFENGQLSVLNLQEIKVTPVVRGQIRNDVWEIWNPFNNVFRVDYPNPLNQNIAEMKINTTSGVNITSIKILYKDDLVVSCLCGEEEPFQSSLNEIYLKRKDTSSKTSYGVTLINNEGNINSIRVTTGYYSPLYPTYYINHWEYVYGTPDCLSNIPMRCNDGTCANAVFETIDNVHEICTCVGKNGMIKCSCLDDFGETRNCYYPECGYNIDLDDASCQWSPLLKNEQGKGFEMFGNSYLSIDLFPNIITFPRCNFNIVNSSYRFETTCQHGITVIRPNHSFILDDHIKNWTFTLSTSVIGQNYIYKYVGGISLLASSYKFQLKSSSNSNYKYNVLDTTSSSWGSSNIDHDVYLLFEFDTGNIKVVSIILEFETLGIIGNGQLIFPSSVYVQGKKVDDKKWTLYANIADGVYNGILLKTVIINDNVHELRIHSFYPIVVKTFIPFVEQTCENGMISGNIPSVPSILNFINKNVTCVCDNSCIYTSNLTLLSNDLSTKCNVCAAGTLCSYCKSSIGTIGCQGLNTDIHNISVFTNRWTLREFIEMSIYTYITHQYDISRTIFTKQGCDNECPLYTCVDGSCVTASHLCPTPRHVCPKNGCVRADAFKKEYSCVCEQGWGGILCNIHECTPGDGYSGKIDPNKWCSCMGPSPLKIRPPYDLIFVKGNRRYLTNTDILSINRPNNHRVNNNDVGWVNIYADKAPFGVAFLRQTTTSDGVVIYTTCPFRAKTRYGIYVELEECVEKRSSTYPFVVEIWKTFRGGEQIIWNYETQYDATPYRCPSGHCVANERDCYTMNYLEPLCNGKGKCLVDGTCECSKGYTTFVISEELTSYLIKPYNNPMDWGHPNHNQYTSEWCNAHDCLYGQCDPPIGCFPGTLELLYQDKLVMCPTIRKCATTTHMCLSGKVTEPTICSSNGELFKRDYRDEYYCKCFKGFGGRACTDLVCQDDPHRIYYKRSDGYLDINFDTLPGKWMGPCGAMVGADPDDILIWNRCCPLVKRLEHCLYVPCEISGQIQCTLIEDCLGLDRKPKVYSCNNKGVAGPDGVCICQHDSNGNGYTYDLDVYSDKGCFKKISCPKATGSGFVCNHVPPCSDMSYWNKLPTLDYIKQQAIIFAAREGLPLNNRSIVQKLAGDNVDELVLQVYVQEAILIQSFIRALATDICIYPPPDNSSIPFGMVPYVGNEDIVGPYMKSIISPYYIMNLTGPLFDGKWMSPFSNYQLFNVSDNSTLFVSRDFNVSLGSLQYIDFIRLHVTSTSNNKISFFDSNNYILCGSVSISVIDSTWIDVVCMQTYKDYRFQLMDPSGWSLNGCAEDSTSFQCLQWQQSECILIPKAHLQLPSSLEPFYGCSTICCIALKDVIEQTTSIQFIFESKSNHTYIDEIEIFGHLPYVTPLTPYLKNLFQTTTNQSECVDEIFFYNPANGILGDHTAFRSNRIGGYNEHNGICLESGGVFTTNIGEKSIDAGYAKELGEACYNGIASDSPGCFVNAIDSREIEKPKSIEHLIDPKCSQFGCYQYNVRGQAISFHADPYTGSQYDSPFVTGQVPWSTYFNNIATVHNTQAASKSRTVKVRYMKAEYIDTTSITQNQRDYDFAFNPETDHPDFTVYKPVSDITQSVPFDHGILNMYVGMGQKECVVGFFSELNCGVINRLYDGESDITVAGLCTNTVPYGPGGLCPTISTGYYKLYYVNPYTYNNILGRDISNDVFDDCVEQDDHHFCTPANAAQLTLKHAKSMFIQGDCYVELYDVDANAPPSPSPSTNLRYWKYGEATFTGSGEYFQNLNRNFYKYPLGGYRTKFYTVVGCYATTGATVGGNWVSVGLDERAFHENSPVENIFIRLKYKTTKIKIEPMVEPHDFNVNDDQSIGYLDHQYMSLSMRVTATQIMSPDAPELAIANVNNVFIGDNPVVAVSTNIQFNGDFSNINYMLGLVYASTTSKPLLRCIECEIRPSHRYEWFQQFYIDIFIGQVETVNQSSPDGGYDARTQLYISYSKNRVDYVSENTALLSLKDNRAYGKLLSKYRASDYGINFFTDHCLKVFRQNSILYQYIFLPANCKENLYSVCIYDLKRYTAAAGTQCDKCGDSARKNLLEPGATAFTRYPRASRNNDPFGFMILDAYLDGSLSPTILSYDLVDWDLIYASITDNQFLFAFPEAIDAFYNGISTRPSYTSYGQLEDTFSWIDMDFKRWFPYTCQNKQVCAISKEYCTTSNFDAPLMNQNQIPTILFNVTSCEMPIYIETYDKSDLYGFGQLIDYTFVSLSRNPLTLEAIRENGSWANTGKYFNMDYSRNFTITFSITTVGSGFFKPWCSQLSLTYSRPNQIFYLVDNWILLDGTQKIRLQNTPKPICEVFGFDFQHLQIGTKITFSKILMSVDCKQSSNTVFFELPSSIVSPIPNNRCLYADEGDLTGGQCYCEENSATQGPACDWPAVNTDRGTLVCNGYGDDGGYAYTSQMVKSPLISNNGIFKDDQSIGCKCIDPGLSFLTILRPESVYGYEFIIRNDALPDDVEYFIVTSISNNLVPPFSYNNYKSICDSQSSILPSWNTADEIDLVLRVPITFVDIQIINNQIYWFDRDELFSYDTILNSSSLTYSSTVYQALNWNNVAFNVTRHILTDGNITSCSRYTSDINIPLQRVINQVFVETYGNSFNGVYIGSSKCSNLHDNVFACYYDSITSIRLIPPTLGVYLCEVRVFDILDTTRVSGY